MYTLRVAATLAIAGFDTLRVKTLSGALMGEPSGRLYAHPQGSGGLFDGERVIGFATIATISARFSEGSPLLFLPHRGSALIHSTMSSCLVFVSGSL